MHQGQFILSQLLSYVNKYEFNKCVEKHDGNYKIRELTCWQQFIYLSFGQLTYRESISDIINCLNSQTKKLYHIGIKNIVAISTLTRANEKRNWQIYADFASYLISIVKPLYLSDNEFTIDLNNTVYALDSSTIDLCLSTFYWAKFRKNKGAIKLHTLLDLRGNIPTFISITTGKVHDVNILDDIIFESGAFYIMDRGYVDFKRIYQITVNQAFYVLRAKKNLKFIAVKSQKITEQEKETGLICDQTIKLTNPKSKKDYPDKLRRIKFKDKELKRNFVFLTNNFSTEASKITQLYKYRWQIELFFKWIKQHLKIKSFWGFSENAVKTQIWISICSYLIVALIKKKCKIEHSLYEILQILSVSIFDKTPINELFKTNKSKISMNDTSNQLNLFDL